MNMLQNEFENLAIGLQGLKEGWLTVTLKADI